MSREPSNGNGKGGAAGSGGGGPPNRNVELKARCPNLAAARQAALAVGARPHGVLVQRDTYFRCTSGRLKLRESDGAGAELIGYHRADEARGRVCRFARTPIPEPDELRRLLIDTLGLRGVVSKRRELWLWRNVRIHLDEVSGLGSFLELEAVLSPEQAPEEGERLLAELLPRFGVAPADVVPVSNIDLLEQQQAGTSG